VAEATLHEALFGPRLSLEEWADLSEDVPGEFVDGRLVEEEVPDYLHEVLVAWLARVIGNWGDTRDVIVGGSDAKFGVSPNRGRKPDLSVFLDGRRPPARGLVRVPPDIAVEVVSPSPRDARRDREEKMSEYSSFGIQNAGPSRSINSPKRGATPSGANNRPVSSGRSQVALSSKSISIRCGRKLTRSTERDDDNRA
jgi:hypothetical protein